MSKVRCYDIARMKKNRHACPKCHSRRKPVDSKGWSDGFEEKHHCRKCNVTWYEGGQL